MLAVLNGDARGKVIIFDSYLIRSEMAAHCAMCAIFFPALEGEEMALALA